MDYGKFILEHIDIIFMAVALPIVTLVTIKIKSPKKYKYSDDITEFIIQHNKYKEILTKKNGNSKKILS